MEYYVSAAFALLMVCLVVGAWRLRKKHVSPGPAAAGMIDQMLTGDRRAAVEIILEERTGERDPEDRDGNLPDLEGPPARGAGPKQ